MPQVQAFLQKEIVALNGFQVTVGTVVIAVIVWYAYIRFVK